VIKKWNRAGVGSRSGRAWKSNQALVLSGVVERMRRAPTTAAAPSAATGTIRFDIESDEPPEPAPVSGNVETVESGQWPPGAQSRPEQQYRPAWHKPPSSMQVLSGV
jgi:hypothetical protein